MSRTVAHGFRVMISLVYRSVSQVRNGVVQGQYLRADLGRYFRLQPELWAKHQ
jgi:hypothetical protein